MTMICEAKNKAELKAKLDAGCTIRIPKPWGEDQIQSKNCINGFKEPVVLDPETRRRFALIEKTANGWKVK